MGGEADSTREPHHDPVAARPTSPEDRDPPFDPDGSWNRLIGISVDEDTDPIAPGTDSWRAILMLWVAADYLPDRERWAAAEQLVDDVFSHPLHPARWRKARSRGVTDDDLRRWAVRYLFEGVWRRERGSANYQDLVYRLKNHLNDRLAAEACGADWEEVVGKNRGTPPRSMDAPQSDPGSNDQRSDDERSLHERLSSPGAGRLHEALEAQEQIKEDMRRIVRMLEVASPQQRKIVLTKDFNPELLDPENLKELLGEPPRRIDISEDDRRLVEADPDTWRDVADAVGVATVGHVKTQYRRCKKKVDN